MNQIFTTNSTPKAARRSTEYKLWKSRQAWEINTLREEGAPWEAIAAEQELATTTQAYLIWKWAGYSRSSN
jgi:hypothetical protein